MSRDQERPEIPLGWSTHPVIMLPMLSYAKMLAPKHSSALTIAKFGYVCDVRWLLLKKDNINGS